MPFDFMTGTPPGGSDPRGRASPPGDKAGMPFDFVPPRLTELRPRILVFGVGGAGGNAVANMIADGLSGVDFVVANTDAQALAVNPCPNRIQLGLRITQGLGAGARPEIGAAAAEEAMEQIDAALEGCHMCFITAGMGGGTGTGAAPVVARAARERGVLTVGVVTKPFAFEGLKRMRMAEAGIAELQRHVDTLIIIPNQNLFLIANQQTGFREAFRMADEVLNQGVKGITDLMTLPGLINLDFADVRTVMSEMGRAMMGTGEAAGERRAIEAAERAVANPLLDEVSLRGAKAVIVNITGGEDLRLMEVEEAAQYIREMVDPEANIIVGSAFNNDLEGRIRISVVATGIDSAPAALAASAEAAARAVAPTPGVRLPAAPLLGGAPLGRAASAAGEAPPPDEPGPAGPAGRPPRPRAGPGVESIRSLVGDIRRAEGVPAALAEEEAALTPDLPEPPAAAPVAPETTAAAAGETQGAAPAPGPAAAGADAGPPRPAQAEVLPLDLPEPEEPTETPLLSDPPEAEERPSLFRRLLGRSRPPREEPRPTETLLPEPEPEAEPPVPEIPPFLRRQQN